MLYVIDYSLFNVVPIHALVDSRAHPSEKKAEDYCRHQAQMAAFTLAVWIETLNLKVLIHLWEEMKVAGHQMK